ncbi:phospholipase D-like domain-containing protein [Picosynechococcus sp. PCC 73109]|uniref:phospholipase D-like domain-containing protein n=1 Tax=Picosynechococcus sp. PCC 73109 TaxID=374982 RepID=UPI00074583C2|nr:phospholipase D-like domain-containing protein [Picosynechococcus sp. PCC 73109]AMA09541.1 competence protein ComE [Picosynechococcus sp. PCC 73109]
MVNPAARRPFFVLWGLLVVGLLGCQGGRGRSPQDESIQVYFNQRQGRRISYTEPYRQLKRPGDNLEEILIEGINSAQNTIDIAIQELNLPLVAEALADQAAAGITIRVIVENNYRQPWAEPDSTEILELDERDQGKYQEFVALADENQDGFLDAAETAKYDAIAILERAKIPILDDTADGSKGSGLMHHKFMVVDGETVITGSANWTLSGIHGDFANPETRGNVNHLMRIQDPAIAQVFTTEFEEMWTGRKFGVQKLQEPPQTFSVGNSRVTVQFSPFSSSQPWENTSNGLIGSTLAQAQESISLALFVFSEQKIANILEKEAQEGTAIRALIDPSFAFREYSDGLDLLGVNLKEKCDPFNRPWANPIQTVGTPKLPKGDKFHHKFAVIDGKTVITGSHNWSAAANNQNDETLLIIQNEAIAQQFQAEFDQFYTTAYLGIPPFIASKQKPMPADCTVAATNGPVNLNTASAVELETLPGIGPSLAQGIIEGRPYSGLTDLQRVSGIGEKKAADLAGKVTW